MHGNGRHATYDACRRSLDACRRTVDIALHAEPEHDFGIRWKVYLESVRRYRVAPLLDDETGLRIGSPGTGIVVIVAPRGVVRVSKTVLAECACLDVETARLEWTDIDEMNRHAIGRDARHERRDIARQSGPATLGVDVANRRQQQATVIDHLRRAERQLQ